MKKIVTPESLIEMLTTSRDRQAKIIGRALVALFHRQVGDEQSTNNTKLQNGIGFAPCDAYSGSLTAKYFMKHKTLLDWQIEKWMQPSGQTNRPRIVKYARQLNEIANENSK
jgi:hypothetical protein